MNIKTLFRISQLFFEQINPNIYEDEDNNYEVDPEVLDELEKDYLYLQDCCKGVLLFISPKKMN